jgi:hypothetical protein
MDHQDPQDGHEGATEEEAAREAAKAFIKPYILDGWTEAELSRKQPVTSRKEFAARVGGGKMRDHKDYQHTISREQIAVTRVGYTPCFIVFDLAEIIVEIREEEQSEPEVMTLNAIFAEQERVALARREDEELQQAMQPRRSLRPAVLRSYQGGFCGHCGEPLGYIEVDGGRDRLYCNAACRVAAHRKRKRERDRQQVLDYNSELRQYWQDNGIYGEVLFRLQEILLAHGKAPAKAATDAVLAATRANATAGTIEENRLIEDIMLGGEEIGFQEITLDNFRIPAGVDGWCEFVSHAQITILRQTRYYLHERKKHQYLKAQARSRLEQLSRNT